MTPKLPPLPEPDDLGDNYYGTPVKGFTAEAMNARYLKGYNDAIAAIKAQGVPDGMVLVEIELLKQAEASIGSFCSDQGWSDYDMRTMDALSAVIASAPPAPQASVLNQSDMPEDMAKVLRENAWDLYATGERASVVQQEPVAWWKPEFENPLVSVGPKQPLLYPDARPLYTHPAPQAKPLSDEQKKEIIEAHAGYGGDDFLSVISAVERYYGIKE